METEMTFPSILYNLILLNYLETNTQVRKNHTLRRRNS